MTSSTGVAQGGNHQGGVAPSQLVSSLESGFIIYLEGIVLTNNRVIANAELNDSRITAKLIDADDSRFGRRTTLTNPERLEFSRS